ncbi:MAG TPA: TetR/AcrR family transcriptional regulator [Opitutaceae bacterium]
MKNPVRARREEEKEKRRKSILDAAERVIARHGWEATNFGEIAKLTRLSRSLVYVYFPTRDDLFHAIVDRGMAMLEQRFQAAIAKQGTGIEQVMALGRAYYEFSKREPFYFDLLSHFQARQLDPKSQSMSEESANTHGRSCLRALAQAIGTGIADGTIRKSIGPPGLAAFAIWAFTHGLIQISERKEPLLKQDFKVSAPQMVEHSMALLRGALVATD